MHDRWNLFVGSALLAWLVWAGGEYAVAASPVAIINRPLWIEPSEFFAGEQVKIFVPLWNTSEETREAEVAVFIDESVVATTTVELGPQGSAVARMLWTAQEGDYTLKVRIVRVARKTILGKTPLPIPENNETATPPMTLIVDRDSDDDRFGDNQDTDDDNDGIPDEQERELGTNPRNPDTDGDGLSDNEELAGGTSPLKADSDGDKLTDKEEARKDTNPLDADTDGDGVVDGEDLLPSNRAISGATARFFARTAVSRAVPIAEGVNSLARQEAQRLETQAQALARAWEAERQGLPSRESEPFSLWWRRTAAAALSAAAAVLRQAWIGWAILILGVATFLWLALRALTRLKDRRSRKASLRERLESAAHEKEA